MASQITQIRLLSLRYKYWVTRYGDGFVEFVCEDLEAMDVNELDSILRHMDEVVEFYEELILSIATIPSDFREMHP